MTLMIHLIYAEISNSRSYTSSHPPVFMARYLINDRGRSYLKLLLHFTLLYITVSMNSHEPS